MSRSFKFWSLSKLYQKWLMVIINVKQYPSLFHEDVHHTHMAYLPSYRAHVRQRCNTGTLPCNAMISTQVSSPWGCPGGTSGKEPACQRKRRKRCGFHPWVGKIPWRRAWQPTPVFLPGESHGQRSLEGSRP